MTNFDAQRALQEELQGLGGVREALIKTERRAQQRMVDAEEEYNTVTKLRGFVDAETARKRAALEAIYDASQR